MTHTRAKVKVIDDWVQQLEWTQTDGRTDGGDCITYNAVYNNRTRMFYVRVPRGSCLSFI